MTTVHVALYKPQRGTTDRTPVAGTLDVSLVYRQVEGDEFVLVTAFSQVLVDGEADLELTPNADGLNAWVIDERVRDGKTRVISVPDTTSTVEYAALPSIDQTTLEPTDQSLAGWIAAAQQANAAMVSAQQAAQMAEQYAAGSLQVNKNLSDLGSAATARTNLGLAAVAASGAKADVGLGNVDNTSDLTKFANTALTGIPTAPTAAAATNSTQLATTAYADRAAAGAGSGASGSSLQKSNNLSDVSSPSTARTNLGLGTAATQASSAFDVAGAAVGVLLHGTANAITGAATAVAGIRNTVDGTSGAYTVTLPAPSFVGQPLLVERIDTTTTNTVAVQGAAGATIEGSTSRVINLAAVGVANESVLLVAESTSSWTVQAGHKPAAWIDAYIGQRIGTPGSATAASLAATYAPLLVSTQAQRYSTTNTGASVLAASAAAPFGSLTTFSGSDIVVNPDERGQTFRGVGAALTGSAMYNLTQNMTAAQRHALLIELFSPAQCGWSTLRVTIGSSDFESFPYPQFFTYDDLPSGYSDDPTMRGFALNARDMSTTIPLLQEILAINPKLRIFASIWHFPDWMVQYGGAQNLFYDKYSQQLATYLVKYVQAMRSYGIPIYALSLKNEPLSTGYTYLTTVEQISLIGTYIGPAFAAAGLQTRIMLMEDNWSNSAYASTVLTDPTANSYIDSVAWHGYSGTSAVIPPLRRLYPQIAHHLTELRTLQTQDWPTSMALMAGVVMANGFANGLSSVTLWNLALDTNGLPTQTATGRRGVVSVAPDGSGTITRNAEYYALAHASRFVHEGAVRIAATTSQSVTAGIQAVAWQNLDGSIVLYAYNSDATPATFQIADARTGQGFPATMQPNELATFVWGTSKQAAPAGTPVTIATPTAPTVTASAGAGQTTLAWTITAPAAPVRQWAVYRGATAGSETLLTTLPAAAAGYTDLVGAAGNYSYRVAAINLAGTGALSPSAPVTLTAPTAPGAMTITIIPNQGYNLVYWSAPPTANGSPLTTYQLLRSTSAGNETLLTTLSASNSVGSADYNVTPGTTYYYVVKAVNAIGVGAASNEVSGTPYSQVNLDAASASTQGSAANTSTWSHTVGTGTNRLLLVSVGTTNGTGGTSSVASVTYGAQSLTRVGGTNSPVGATERLVDLWMLLAPASGTASITVTLASGVTSNLGGSATSFSGVSQSKPLGTAATVNNTSGTSLAPAVTGASAHDIVYAAGIVRASAQPTLGSGQTASGPAQISGNAFLEGSTQTSANGTVTPTFTIPTADAGAAIAVPVLNG